MSTISASTASNTAFKVTSDTTGTLVFQTGAVPTTAISIDASQVVSIGNIAVTGATTFAAGSAAAPSITTTGDTNTGIFFPAADTIGFSEGGVEAARFDSSGNLGLGVTPNVWLSSFRAIQLGQGSSLWGAATGSNAGFDSNAYVNTSGSSIYVGSTFATRYQQNDGKHMWNTAASGTAGNTISFTQAMTLAANGNLLVGTTTDKGYRVLVSGADADDDPVLGSATGAFHVSNSDVTYGMDFGVSSDGKGWIQQQSNTGAATAYDLSLQPVGGNVGIGTSSPAGRLDVASASGSGNAVYMRGGNYTNISFATGIRFLQPASTLNANRQVRFSSGDSNLVIQGIDGSGADTSDVSICFQPSGGNLGIGTTSPGALLHTYTATQESVRFARNSTASSAYVTFYANNSSSAQVQYAGILGDVASSTAGSHSGNLLFYTTGSGTSAERVRIDSSGNVGIGTSSPLGKLHAKGTAVADVVYRLEAVNNSYSSKLLISSTSSGDGGIRYGDSGGNLLDIFSYGDMRFFVGTANISGAVGNERARITSAGKMLVGTTSTSGTLTVDGVDAVSTGSVSTYAITCGNDAADALAFGSDASFAYVQSFGSRPLILNMQGNEIRVGSTTDQGAYNLQVNGTGVWGAGAYVNGSDARLKDNIQSLDSGLDVVKAMRPVTFQYKPEYNKDQSVQPGFIAQELQEAMAGKAYLDGVVHSGPEHLNVAYQNIIPILVKAIQELEAKFAALESK